MATVDLNQYYATGTVTSANGATGVMQTLIPLCVGTEVDDEVIDDTPNGSKTSFSGTLDNYPVGRRRLIISYTDSGDDTTYTCSDDGTGVITDDSGGYLTSGSITHSTGAWTLVFSSAPKDTTDITADYLYGAMGRDWRQLYSRNTRDDNNVQTTDNWSAGDCKEYMLHSTGTSGQEDVIIGIREWQYTSSNIYSSDLNIYSSYSTDQAWNANQAITGRTYYDDTYHCWGSTSYGTGGPPQFTYNDTTMTYYLYSNQQRIVICLDISGNDESMYIGSIRRYGSRADYPYPVIAKGNSWGRENYASTDSQQGRDFILNCYSDQYAWNLMTIRPDNSIPAQGGSGGEDTSSLIYPMMDYNHQGTRFMKESYGDERTHLEVMYVVSPPNNYVLGDFDGVLHCPSTTINAHDTIEDRNTQIRYRVFKNVNRINDYDFMCVAQENFTTTTTTTTTTAP